MSIFSDNIRFLRNKKNLSQQSFAESLGISRVRYSKYEDGRSEPPYGILIGISKFFSVSVDLLLTLDISKYPLENMVNLPDNKTVLPVVVDSQGNNYIEIVPQKASMGYLNGYSDPEYIESLPRIHLPFLGHGKFRGFMADGDSMPPFIDGTCVVGEYVESLDDLKAGKAYIFVTPEGMTFKTYVSSKTDSLTVSADNSFYEPYDIPLTDIAQIWNYTIGILPKDYKPIMPDYADLKLMIERLKKTIHDMESKVSVYSA